MINLAKILEDHIFVHDGWCACSEPSSRPITSGQWVNHVAEVISEAYNKALKEIWYG